MTLIILVLIDKMYQNYSITMKSINLNNFIIIALKTSPETNKTKLSPHHSLFLPSFISLQNQEQKTKM